MKKLILAALLIACTEPTVNTLEAEVVSGPGVVSCPYGAQLSKTCNVPLGPTPQINRNRCCWSNTYGTVFGACQTTSCTQSETSCDAPDDCLTALCCMRTASNPYTGGQVRRARCETSCEPIADELSPIGYWPAVRLCRGDSDCPSTAPSCVPGGIPNDSGMPSTLRFCR